MQSQHNTRAQLLDLGIGDFNATLVIPQMMIAPAQGDPDMTQVKVLTKAFQKTMQQMGATWILATGYIDQETAYCLQAIAGQHWNELPWFDLVHRLLAARDGGHRFARKQGVTGARAIELSGLPDVSGIPGGYVTIGLGAFLAYRYLTKKGR